MSHPSANDNIHFVLAANATTPPQELAFILTNVRNQWTGLMAGTFVDLVLAGICARLLVRHMRIPGPRTETHMLYLAASLSALATCIHMSHIHSLMVRWGYPKGIQHFYWENSAAFLLNGAAMAAVNSLYGYKLYKVSVPWDVCSGGSGMLEPTLAYTSAGVRLWIEQLWGSKLMIRMGLTMLILFALTSNCAVTVLTVNRPRVYDKSPALLRWIKRMGWLAILMNASNLAVIAAMGFGTAHALYTNSIPKFSECTWHHRVERILRICSTSLILPLIFSLITLIVAQRIKTFTAFLATLRPLHKVSLLSALSLLLARNETQYAFLSYEERRRRGQVSIAMEQLTTVSKDEFQMKNTTNRGRRPMLA